MSETPRRCDNVHPLAFIHPKAHVENAEIGAATRIWQFATVIRGARLGIDCNVASNVTLDGSAFGDRCIISPGADIGPGIAFGDDCFIGPCVVVCNDGWPLTSKEGWSTEPFKAGALTVKVGNGVSVGANATVLAGVRIGDGSMIAAGAVVDRDVLPGHLFKRSGEIVPIDASRDVKRMRLLA